jgi:hypothetical protein
VDLDRAEEVGLAGAFKTQSGTLELLIIAIVDEDGETALVSINSGELPPVEGLAREALHLPNRQFPDIVEHKSMPRIEERRSIRGVEV